MLLVVGKVIVCVVFILFYFFFLTNLNETKIHTTALTNNFLNFLHHRERYLQKIAHTHAKRQEGYMVM